MSATDVELVLASKTGDTDALVTLWKRYSTSVRKYTRAYTKHLPLLDVEDVQQMFYIRLLIYIQWYQPQDGYNGSLAFGMQRLLYHITHPHRKVHQVCSTESGVSKDSSTTIGEALWKDYKDVEGKYLDHILANVNKLPDELTKWVVTKHIEGVTFRNMVKELPSEFHKVSHQWLCMKWKKVEPEVRRWLNEAVDLYA